MQPCSEVFEHIYVSGYDVACNREELDKRSIRYIVNCASSACANAFETDPQFTYLTLNMMDGGSEDLGWFFPQVSRTFHVQCCVCSPLMLTHDCGHVRVQLLAFIDDAVNAQQSVLIHCQKGISRSCAVACLYGMYSKHMTFHVAANLVKARRSIASPNSIFLCNLIEMECLFRGEATNDKVRPVVFLINVDAASCSSYVLVRYSFVRSYVVFQTQKFPVLFRLAHHAVWDASTVVLKICRDPVTRVPVRLHRCRGACQAVNSCLMLLRMSLRFKHATGCCSATVAQWYFRSAHQSHAHSPGEERAFQVNATSCLCALTCVGSLLH
jgi:protein-tyrosine phosphatase